MTLDDLGAMRPDELDATFRGGRVPVDMSALDHQPKGRVVGVRLLSATPLRGLLASLAKLSIFPWDGKSLAPTGAQTADGINRMRLGSLRDMYPFKTRVEPSVIDGQPCIFLDYEQPGNPVFIRKIHDELREVTPGLFLGPAMWKTGPGKAELVLWFALDGNA